jgi:biopolymer transport protein ExbB/TolQ
MDAEELEEELDELEEEPEVPEEELEELEEEPEEPEEELEELEEEPEEVEAHEPEEELDEPEQVEAEEPGEEPNEAEEELGEPQEENEEPEEELGEPEDVEAEDVEPEEPGEEPNEAEGVEAEEPRSDASGEDEAYDLDELDLDTIAAEAAAANAAAAAGTPTARRQLPVSPAALKAAAPLLSAVVASLVLQLVIGLAVDPGSYLYRLIRPPGGWVMALVPALIIFLLAWTMVELLLKHLDMLENERDLGRREIRRLPSLVVDEPPSDIQRRILSLEGSDRTVSGDARRTHELLRHQADLEADTAAGHYRTVKLFVWAMPILGFIGTVLGISLAVGGFSEFLTTNLDIDDVGRVTNELGSVASGLSFAFDTTLLGLLAGLLANVASSHVQKRDERFLTRLEELGLSIVASSRPPEGPKVPRLTDPDFELAIRERIEEVDQLVDRTRRVMQELSAASARMNIGLNQSVESMRQTVERLGTGVHGMAAALTAEKESQAAVETAVGQLATSISAFGQRVTEALAADAESQAAVETAVAQLATSIATFGEGLSEALAADAASQQSIEQAVERLAESISTFGEGVSEALAADTESQASVERAVERLVASMTDFGEGITKLQVEHEALMPVLSQLAYPLDRRVGAGGTEAETHEPEGPAGESTPKPDPPAEKDAPPTEVAAEPAKEESKAAASTDGDQEAVPAKTPRKKKKKSKKKKS